MIVTDTFDSIQFEDMSFRAIFTDHYEEKSTKRQQYNVEQKGDNNSNDDGDDNDLHVVYANQMRPLKQANLSFRWKTFIHTNTAIALATHSNSVTITTAQHSTQHRKT